MMTSVPNEVFSVLIYRTAIKSVESPLKTNKRKTKQTKRKNKPTKEKKNNHHDHRLSEGKTLQSLSFRYETHKILEYF